MNQMESKLGDSRSKKRAKFVRTTVSINTVLGAESLVQTTVGDLAVRRRGSFDQFGFREKNRSCEEVDRWCSTERKLDMRPRIVQKWIEQETGLGGKGSNRNCFQAITRL